MAEFFNYDPLTGVTEYIEHDPFDPGKISIHSVQDLKPFLEHANQSRINGATDGGIKESWWLYAKIPAVYQIKLRQLGMKMSNPDDHKRIEAHINTHWPHLKMTEKKHGGKVKQYHDLGAK